MGVGEPKPQFDVFISYAKKRHRLTAGLANDLKAAGFSCWWDTRMLAGESFNAVIDQQLEACRAAIIIWTPESIKSDWVLAEASHALQLKKLINVHVPALKPTQIPKPYNQRHSVKLSDRDAIIAAVSQYVSKPIAKAKPRSSRPWLAAGALLAALAIGVVGWVLIPKGLAPAWNLEKTSFLREPMKLAWNFDRSAAAGDDGKASVWFELESAPSWLFWFGRKLETTVDGDHYDRDHVNASRYWRVRAFDFNTKATLSNWSKPTRITQYDSAYDRIKDSSEALVYISDSQDQDLFKWSNSKGLQGFDIKLVDGIVHKLADRLGRPVKPHPIPANWGDLLDKPGSGEADFVISSITRTKQREQQSGVKFSDPYYCTSYALLYRAGVPDGAIGAMLAGKTVGVQSESTGASLAQELAKGGLFQVKAFPNMESMISALLDGKIDYGITDTSFAVAARMKKREPDGTDRLAIKKFQRQDMPPGVPDVQEYAVAVSAGERALLKTINDVLDEAKQDGSLTRLLKESTEEFEDANNVPRGSRGEGLSERPWECIGEAGDDQSANSTYTRP
jgi:ABC-type amino acid transport substrate-binding protein